MSKEMELKQVLNKLKGEDLYEGEIVLWKGQAEPFKFAAGKEGKQNMISMILSTVVVLILYMFLWEDKGGADVLVVGVFMAYIWGSKFYQWKSVSWMRYWVTNRRVCYSSVFGVDYIDLEQLDAYQLVWEEGMREQSIVLGSCIAKDIGKRLRWRASNPMGTSSVDEGVGFVFYNIKDAGMVSSLLETKQCAA